MYIVTLVRCKLSSNTQKDFPGLMVREINTDEMHLLEVVVPDLGPWMVEFYKSAHLVDDYGIADVEAYPRETVWTNVCGPLEPWSNAPPTPPTTYPNYAKPLPAWYLPPLRTL